MAEKIYTIKVLDRNIVEVTLKEHVYLDMSITDAIEQDLNVMVPNERVYQLVIAKGPYIVNPEMRNSMSKSETVKQAAIAWISPDEKSNQEQEAIVSKLPLPLKIRFFSSREDGLGWLQSMASGK
jgi:hypothetical protein